MRFRPLKNSSGTTVFMAYTPRLRWQDEKLLGDIGIDTTNPWHAEEWYDLKQRLFQEDSFRKEGKFVDVPKTLH